jgi:tetratricopeptide (TPR) repeat protein
MALEPYVLSEGFRHFYNLQYDDAIGFFRKEAARNPESADCLNHLAQAILYRDMYRSGALESELVTGNNPFLRRPKVNASPEDQREFEEKILKAIELSRARLAEDPRDTRALYALGVSHGLRANYNFLVRKAWRAALRDGTTARRHHNKVTEIDPSFIDARLVQGVHDYVVGSLPWTWKILGFLAGFRGDRDEGIRSLELVAAKGRANRIDAQVLLCAIYRREKKPRLAVPLLNSLRRQFPQNYLFSFELAQMYSDLGEKVTALAALQRLEKLKKSGAPGYSRLQLEKISYAQGNIQFWYNDLDPALENIQKAAAGSETLDLNTGVLAWMRLGQIYDLKGQRSLAVEAYRHAIAFAPDSEAAKESRRYLSSPYRRTRS